jgi:hypothetical protein
LASSTQSSIINNQLKWNEGNYRGHQLQHENGNATKTTQPKLSWLSTDNGIQTSPHLNDKPVKLGGVLSTHDLTTQCHDVLNAHNLVA